MPSTKPAERTPSERITSRLSEVSARHFVDCSEGGHPKPLQKLLDAKTGLGYLARGADAPVRLLIDEHFVLDVDVLLKDAELGTLGLVQIVPGQPHDHDGKAISYEDWCKERIDEAVYLRHVLLTETRNADTRPRPQAYTVELVLAFTGETHELVPSAGAALRSLASTGTFLHAIGIHLWRLETEPAEKALPWLLCASRRALTKLQQLPDTAKSGLTFSALTLNNFRVQGERRFEFSSKARVHLVHGPNGSGKSSIVEAIELGMTGKIPRIEKDGPATDYEKVLKNRDAAEQATLRFGSGAVMTVVPGGIDPSPFPAPSTDAERSNGAPRLDGNSFRLNQDLADHLAASSAGNRAATFIQSFFPDKSMGFAQQRESTKRFERAWQALPAMARAAVVRPNEPPRALHFENVTSRLSWLGEQVNWAEVVQLLSQHFVALDVEWTSRLPGRVQERLRATGICTWDEAISYAIEIDNALASLRSAAQEEAQDLHHAVRALENLNARSVVHHRAREENVPALFNEWLEATAEADLAVRVRDVTEILRLLERPGTNYRAGSLLTMLAKDLGRTRRTIDEQATRLAKQAAELNERLRGIPNEGATRGEAVTPEDVPLEDLNLEALDRVAARGVLGPEMVQARPSLADAIRDAFRGGRPVEMLAGRTVLLRVGQEQGWASVVLERLRREQSSLALFSKAWTQDASVQQTLEALKTLLVEARAVEQAEAQADRTLHTLLTNGALLDALNEVKALLSPARWAYRELQVSADFTRNNELGLSEPDGVTIPKRLNTAELNITALAFFLLFARRVPNPLRVIVLDDPLQNMDELTVTTVARAMAKIERLWRHSPGTQDEGWKILLLLHGQDDAERFRVEVPCAFYRLPWLGPIGAPNDFIIKDEGSLLADDFQPLTNTLSELPAS